MRVSSLVIGLLIVGGLVYVFMFTDLPSKLMNTAGGFTPAKTPDEAVTRFTKAVKARKYKTAATYVTADYAELLNKANDAATEVSGTLDGIMKYMKNKGYESDKALAVLHYFDPLPPLATSTVTKVDDTTSSANLAVEDPGFSQWGNPANFEPLKGLRPVLFTRPLTPAPIFGNPIVNMSTVKIKKVGDEWKIDVLVTDLQKAAVNDYIANYKALRNGLDGVRQDLTNNSRTISTKQEFADSMMTAVNGSK
ncbi:MAG: hypothetical protein U0744_19665 [Gemmataceae bacterium]